MGTTITTSTTDRIEKVRQALEAAQKLQDDRLRLGIDHVNLYVEDIESDWLENWGEDKEDPLQTPVNLGRWFQNIFDPGWQAVEQILCSEDSRSALVFRTAGVKRAKAIDSGIELAHSPIALIITIKQEADRETGILVQVYSTGDRPYLPEGLQLSLFSSNGEILHEVAAKSADYAIQMELSGQPGEQFSLQVALDDYHVKESFVI